MRNMVEGNWPLNYLNGVNYSRPAPYSFRIFAGMVFPIGMFPCRVLKCPLDSRNSRTGVQCLAQEMKKAVSTHSRDLLKEEEGSEIICTARAFFKAVRTRPSNQRSPLACCDTSKRRHIKRWRGKFWQVCFLPKCENQKMTWHSKLKSCMPPRIIGLLPNNSELPAK